MTEDNCYPLLEQTQLTTQNLTGKEDWRESNVDELVDALERVYQDRDEANMRGAQGAKFMGDWTWEKRTEPLIERIHQTIQNR